MPEVKSHPCFLTPQNLNPDYPLFVFLPGMDGTGKLLHTQTESLEQSFDIHCLAIPPDDLNDWDVLSQQVVDLIEAQIRKQPQRSVYLCGESFGGCLALKAALRSPELFDRIILVNPASSFNQRFLFRCIGHFADWVPDAIYQVSNLGLLPFLAALGRMTPRDRRTLLDAMKFVQPETVRWRLSLLNNFDVDENRLRRLTQPILLLAGAADRLLPSVAEAEHLVRIFPNAQMVVLPKSGHACLLETDVRLYEILKAQNFLEADVPQSALMPINQ